VHAAGAGAPARPPAPGDAAASPAPRAAAGAARSGSSASTAASSARRKRQRQRRAASPPRGGGRGLDTLSPVGERPPAPWHPVPLSELMILIGTVAALVAVARGPARNLALLAVGLAAVAIGTVEVTLREHLSGYRSHTIVLSLLPVVVLDSAVVLLLAPFGAGAKLIMLVVDVALVVVLYRVLRARFLDARRERVFTQGR
jgi:hypothetical protein